ncbi:hypothetical protein PTI98_013630 [Pleurotus ostreatus]|nr:hypothetical protein PTI98_013630 [Pleurotus ostreatus]
MNADPENTSLSQPIRVAQVNAQRKKEVVEQLLNEHINKFDVIIIQEPPWAFIGHDESGREIKGPVGHASWTPIIPNNTSNNNRPRTMTYAKRNVTFSTTSRSDIFDGLDAQVLELKQEGNPNTLLINVYNDSSQGANSVLHQLRHASMPNEQPVIIAGDFNLDHALWSREPFTYQEDTEAIVDWLSQQGFGLLNEKGCITHPARHRGERDSVLDLTWQNGRAIAEACVHEFEINAAISGDSDHFGLTYTIDYSRHEITNPFGIQFSLKDVKPAEWVKALESHLLSAEDKLHPLLEEHELTPPQLDSCEQALTQAIQRATEDTGKWRRPSAKAKPWWDQELTSAVKRIAETRAELQDLSSTIHDFNGPINARIKKARNYFKRLVKYKKKQWIDEKLKQATTDDIWDFQNWSKGVRNYPMPPISRGEGRPKATEHEDKCDAIRDELYQPPPPPYH